GLAPAHLATAESLARQLPLLRVERAFFKVQGEKYILPSSLVQFVVKARFIPPGTSEESIPAVEEGELLDVDPAEGDVLAAQKQEVEQFPIPLVFAPRLPRERGARWHVFLADNRQGKIAVPPFTFSSFDKPAFAEVEGGEAGEVQPTFKVVTLKMQFQAPPQAGEYRFQMHGVCDSYVGFDWKREVVMVVEEAGKVAAEEGDVEEDEISEPEEDTIAGQMASLRGQPVADPNAPPKPPKQRRQIRRKSEEEESDYESGTDEEDEDEESATDTDTDSDEE
ncbi:secretory subunit, partial [Teratosphaeriaceae sp. CCFEE 6253]